MLTASELARALDDFPAGSAVTVVIRKNAYRVTRVERHGRVNSPTGRYLQLYLSDDLPGTRMEFGKANVTHR